MTRLRDALRSPDARWLLAVFAVAFVVRLIVAVTVTPDPRDGRYDDTVWYDTTARHLADGDGYVFDPTVWVTADGQPIYPGEEELSPTALWPPGYPITLAGVYAVTEDSVAAGRLLNVVFGSLTVALVFLIALKLFGRMAAVGSGMALALMPSHVLFTSILLSETYFGFLLASMLALLVYFVFAKERANLPAIALIGAVAAFTGYVRGEFLVFGAAVAVLVALHFKREALLPLAALAFGALLVVTPWTIRNARTMDEPIVGTTGAGRVMYQGHNPEADGGPSLEATFILEGMFAGLDRKDIELRTNDEGSRLAREWAMDHKLRELQLVGLRTFHLMKTDEAGVTWLQSNKPWFSQENADKLITASTAWFYALIALTLASMPLWWRWRDLSRWTVFSIIPFNLLVFGVLFIGDPRYHYAMYVPLAVFSGVGIAAIARLTVAQWRDVTGRSGLPSLRTRFGGGAG